MKKFSLHFPSGEVVHQADTLELAEYAAKNLVEIPEGSRLYVSDPSGVVLSTWFPSSSAGMNSCDICNVGTTGNLWTHDGENQLLLCGDCLALARAAERYLRLNGRDNAEALLRAAVSRTEATDA